MEAVIGGKLFDTEKAEEIGYYSNNLGNSDFRNISEGLYKTKNGAFFLSGYGEPMTKYARKEGNMTYGSKRITPLSNAEA